MAEPATPDTDSERDPAARPTSLIGTAFRRVDGRAKVTGQTKFADDLFFPRMAFMKLVRSTVPHGRILRIDLEEARRVPGVLGVLTGADFPIPFGILPVSQDEHALCPDLVRFVGDPVAAVAATTEDAAAEAALRVRVDYELLPTIASIDDAIRISSPQIHDYADDGNLHKKVSMEFGDVEEAFAESEQIFEDTFFYEGNTHLPIEQHATVALPEDDDRITVYSSTQTPHYLHRALAKVLELPAARVRVVACSNGGGFGGKSDPFNHEIVAAKMALVLGRPVKITLDRQEVFYCHRGRHPVLMHVRTGIRRDQQGRVQLTAQHLRTALDGGGYGSYGVASTYYTGALQTVTYELPRYRFDGLRAFTNKPPCGPKRGHGTPQPRFVFEVHLDKIAVATATNPADLRLGMLAEPDSITANWLKIGSMGLRRCIEAVVAGRGFRERWGRLPEGRGLGLACGAYLCGAGLPIYWNHMPQSGVTAQARPLGRRGGVLRRGRDRPGLGFDSRRAGRRGARRRAAGHPPLRRRHRSHAGRPRQLFVAGHADDGQRRARGGGARARPDRQGGGRAARSSGLAPGLRGAKSVRRRRSRPRPLLPRGGDRRRSPLRHARHHRLLHPAALAGQVPRRRRGTLARLLLHRGRGRGRRSIPRPDSGGRCTSGSLTTSGARSIRCW